jgi:hypothetical protein
MTLKKQLALTAVLVATAFGGFASAQAKKPAAGKIRVFFVEPKAGATVSSPLHLKFGSEGIQISPIPTGDVKEPRPGMGHYHLGIDQRCMQPNQTIVKGTPNWIHFGDGKSEFDTQLTPGMHRLSLQVADDLHMTLPDSCEEIRVNVK